MSELADLRRTYEAIEAPRDITVVAARAHLEEAIRRDQSIRGRQRKRRRRFGVLAVAALVAICGTASAFATVNGFSKLRELLSVEPFVLGEQTRMVEGLRFSFAVSHGGWENGPAEKLASGRFRNRGLFVSKSTSGPQGARRSCSGRAFFTEARALRVARCSGRRSTDRLLTWLRPPQRRPAPQSSKHPRS